MALVLKDRVKVTTTTTGTGAFAIGGAQFGFQGFSAFANGDTTYYTAVDNATGDWETGVGTYNSAGPTLARTTVLDSSNAGGLVNFGVGTKDMFVVYPAGRVVSTEGNVTLTGPLSVPAGASGAQVPQAQETYGPKNGQLAGMRNKIINGKMEIAQRGTSFAGLTNIAAYTLDRWVASVTTPTGVLTVSQQLDAPSNNEFQYSLRAAVTTADTSIAPDEFVYIRQPIEGFNVRDLIGQTFTLSFWVRSAKTGVHCVAFRNSGGDRSYVMEYAVNASNTWEFKTVTVSGGLITAGTWNWTNGFGLGLTFALAAGSNFQTTPNAWQTSNYLTTANQVNCLDTVGNIFAITGVQLEVGKVATPFEHRLYGQELALCQRYFEEVGTHIRGIVAAANGFLGSYVFYKVTKRAAPTLTPTGSITAANVTAESQDEIVVDGFRYSLQATSANTDTYIIGRRFLVIAEL